MHLPLCPRSGAFQPPPRAGRGSRRRSQKAQEEQKRPVQPFGHQARRLCGAPEPRHRDVRRHPAAGGAGRYQGLSQGAVFRLRRAVCAGDPAGSAQPLHRPRRRGKGKAGKAGRHRVAAHPRQGEKGHRGDGAGADRALRPPPSGHGLRLPAGRRLAAGL